MRILVSSDWHPDKSTAGYPRFNDVARAATDTVDMAIQEKVGAYLFLGDLCDPDAGPIVLACAELALRSALRLRMHGICSYWLAGNHCVVEDGTGNTSLTPLLALERTLDGPTIEVWDRPAQGWLTDEVLLVALPYTATSHPYDPAGLLEGAALQVVQPHLRTIVVASHLHIAGVQPGEETTELARGREVLFPKEAARELVRKAEANDKRVVFLSGHYHEQQVFREPGYPDIHIAGSLARLTFGAERHEPGYLLVEV